MPCERPKPHWLSASAKPVMRDGWRRSTLGEVADIVIGRTPPRNDPRYWTTDLSRPFCTIADMTASSVNPQREGVTKLAVREGKARPVPPGGLLLSFKLSIGRVGFAARTLYPNEAIAWLRPRNRDVDPRYLAYWLEHEDLTTNASRAVKGQTLNSSSLQQIPVEFPPLCHQRRIVDLIGRLDQLQVALSALSRAATAARLAFVLEATVGADRTLPLSALVTTARAGGTPSRRRPDFFQGAIPWLKSAEVRNPAIRGTEECISEEGLISSAAWLLPEGAVVVAMYGATAGAVGRVAAPMATNQAVLALVSDQRLLDQSFLFHLLATRSQSMKSRAMGAAQPNLSKERVLQEEIPLPDLVTQQRVAGLCDLCTNLAQAVVRTAARANDSRSSLLQALLAGEIELPNSYDRFVGIAS